MTDTTPPTIIPETTSAPATDPKHAAYDDRSLRITLGFQTSSDWTDTVMRQFDNFLVDHAACERKASGMAISLCTHYPDKPTLVQAMSELAVEELMHYREVIKWMIQRGLQQQPDKKDPYIAALHHCMRRGTHTYLRDRLLLAGIIECRGHERFSLIADALPAGQLKQFYRRITQSEDRHHELFIKLAFELCPNSTPFEDNTPVQERLAELLAAEADIIKTLPIRANLH